MAVARIVLKTNDNPVQEVELALPDSDTFVFVEVNGREVAGIDVGGGSIGTWVDPDHDEWERRIEIGPALGASEGEGLFHMERREG